MASYVKWIDRLREAVRYDDQDAIAYCRDVVFPKDKWGNPGELYVETLKNIKEELEKHEAKKPSKKAVSKRRRTKTDEKS
jgi:hypothetical protein|tara:strand:- start:100 stop:339 length:240 start_codon:yes stop_codon:yes gene_type:complete